MFARILGIVTAVLLCGTANATQVYAVTMSGMVTPIADPTSSGMPFCSANPTYLFAFRTLVQDSAPGVQENVGAVQLPVQFKILTFCENRLNPRVRIGYSATGGSATPGMDYQNPTPAFVEASVVQFASDVDSSTSNLTINVIDDALVESTETAEIGYFEIRYIFSNAAGPDTEQVFPSGLLSPEIALFIADNDSAPTEADLVIEQKNNAGVPLAVGDTFEKTIDVTNNGPADATNIGVIDTLPPQLTFVSSDCGATASGQTVSYTIAALASTALSACNLTVRVVSAGTIVNTANISGSTPTDPVPSNNSTTSTIGTAIANQPPTVSSCSAATVRGQAVTFDLLPCASDPEGGPLTFTAGPQPPPAQGTFSVSGHFATFTPAASFVGTVQLPIDVRDDANNVTLLTATVTVTGSASNLPPVATNGSAATTGILPVTVNLATRVTDPENDALTFAVALPPSSSQGTATLSGSTLTFTPTRGFQGNAVIGLTVRDLVNPPVAFTVTVTVTNNPLNRPPVPTSPSVAAPQSSGGAEVSVNLVPVFTDPDGDALAYAIATQATNGTARVVGQTALYVPNPNFEGADQFVVRATDPAGLSATVIITVGVDANLDPEDTEDDLNGALDTIGGGSEVAQGTVTAVADACGDADSGSDALATCNALVDAAEANDGAAVEEALENLAAEEISAQSNVATAIMTQQKANVAARMASVRGGSNGLDVAGLSVLAGNGALSLGMFGQNLNAAQDDSGAGGVGDLRPSPWGVFINGNIGGGNRDGGGTESGFDFDNYGLTAGVDYRLNDRAFVGLALGYSASEVDLDNESGELDTDGLGLTAYYSWYGTTGWYVDGSLGYFGNDYEQQRVIDLSSVGLGVDRALSETDASQFVATFGVGYEFSRNGWLLTPEFRIEYADTDIDGFDETGNNDSGFLLSFPDQNFQSLQYSAALQVARAFSTASGVVQPFVRLDWIYESDNDGFTIIPRLRSDPTQPFAAVVIDDPDRNFGSFSGGLSWVRPGGMQFYLSLYRTFAYDDLEQWALRGGLRWEF